MPQTSPLVLFFDCFIISSQTTLDEAHSHRDASVGNLTKVIRSTPTVYRAVTKLEEVMYTLLSYRTVVWDHMVLRVECEDEADRAAFFKFAHIHFPDAQVLNQRSATAAQYVQALTPLKNMGDPWVFFSPNNDHPLIGDPHAFAPLMELAQDIERLYPTHFVSILYSHFTEAQNSALPEQFNWCKTMGNAYMTIGETSHASVVKSLKFTCDSVKIYRLSALLTMFSQATTTGRCIRLEDTGLYLTKEFREITILPKTEICRHFDGYPHIDLAPAPLFIPPGFFESAIKIRYGFDTCEPGSVSVNPFEEYSYMGGSADLRCLLSELPHFWQSRISSVQMNPNMHTQYASQVDEAFHFGAIRNPYSASFVFANYARSAWNAAGNLPSEFNESLCSTSLISVPAAASFTEHTTASTTHVYFVLSGVITSGVVELHRNDFLAVQGEAAFTLQVGERTPAKVLRVVIQVGGEPGVHYQMWRKT